MKEKSKKLIFITGGHSTPAVACIEELRSRGFDNIIYIGQKKSLLFDKNVSSEYRLITEQIKLPFKSITAGKLSRFLNFHSLIWILRIPVGFLQALIWQISLRPSVILTFGSHVGVPVSISAWIFRTPVIAHEQTVTIGKSNKLIQRFATKVCYSWENSIQLNDESNSLKYIFTGNPIRKDILNVKTDNFQFSDNSKPVLFITGGNQGANAINTFVFASLESLSTKYNIIHQTGSNTIFNDYEKAFKLSKDLNKNGISYIPKDYIFVEEMAEAYSKSALLISRGGANTVTELLALKKKAIIIPIATSSGNEQFLNGKLLEELGLARILNQNEFDSINLLSLIEESIRLEITDPERVERLASFHRGAEKKIIDEVMLSFKSLTM